MPDALLKTKLLIPPLRPPLAPRPRLGGLLRRALDRPLTLVSAPAGCGKTTAVLAAARALEAAGGVTLAWLSLDPFDDVPARFWRYLVAALHPAAPAVGADLAAALALPQPPPIRPLLATLLNALAERPGPVLLVLDDYHCIGQAEIHDGLAYLLEHAPPSLHLVLATRADPPLPLHRWRARGQLLDIRVEQLRFDHAEAAALLTGTMDLALSEAEVAGLVAQTEGWAAGLHLAGLALQGAAPAQRDLVARLAQSKRYSVDYLAEEVLSQQPAPVQAFLLQTSILGQLCAELCDAVILPPAGERAMVAGGRPAAGAGGSAAILEELVRRNLFVAPVGVPEPGGDGRAWYRYHQLFAELLQSQLRARRPGLAATLHRRAAAWHGAHGAVEAAIEHALAGEDYAQAIDLLDRHAGGIIMEGRGLTVERWLQQLPEAWRQIPPRASLAFAWTLLLRGRFSAVEAQLQQAEAALAAADRPLWGEIHALRSVLAGAEGRAAEALAHARLARADVPADNLFVQAMAQYSLAEALAIGGDVDAAVVAYEQAAARCHAAGLLLPELLSRAHLGALCFLQGRLRRAEAATRPALAGLPHHPAAGAALCALGEVLIAWGRLAEAEQLVRQGLALVRQSGDAATLVRGQALLARLRRAQGDPAGAQATLDSALADLAGGAPAWVAPFVLAELVQLRLAEGATAAAEQLLADSAADAGNIYVREALPLARARLRLQQSRHADALALLDPIVGATEAGGRQGRLIEALVLRALAHAGRGDGPAAHADLGRALALAAPEGHLWGFLDAGPGVATLLRGMQDERGGGGPLIAQLLAALDGKPSPPAAEPQPLNPQPLPEPLTAREREILRLMARGLTYQQIADELIVSINTVRYHVKGLYAKLQAETRTLAVERARELGLLGG